MNGAAEVLMAYFCIKSHSFGPIDSVEDPFCANLISEVQARTCQVLLPHPPPVLYDELPARKNEDWTLPPTDYLGMYFPGDNKRTGCRLYSKQVGMHKCNAGRRIVLDRKKIEDCARRLKPKNDKDHVATREALERVVLIHELMHAMIHTGCARKNGDYKERPCHEDVHAFLTRRLGIWKSLSMYECEQHAQLATWHIIKSGNLPKEEMVFLDLMKGQPKDYMLDPALLKTSPHALWCWMCLLTHDVWKEAAANVKTKMSEFVINWPSSVPPEIDLDTSVDPF